MVRKKVKQQLALDIITYLATNPSHIKLVEESHLEVNKITLKALIEKKFPLAIQISDIYSVLLAYMVENPVHYGSLLLIQNAIRTSAHSREDLRKLHKDILYHLNINISTTERDKQLGFIETVDIDRLTTPYPPPNHWIHENQIIHDLWFDKTQLEKQPDKRLARNPMHAMDIEKLQLDVPEGKSMIFRDLETQEIIGMVVRRWVVRSDIVNWADDVVVDGCEKKRSARLEDPGKICQVGFSGGLRSRPAFDWTRNLLKKNHSPDVLSAFDYSCSSVYAMVWNMCTSRLPKEIIQDFNNFLNTSKLPRMQNTINYGTKKWTNYTVKADDKDVVFKLAEMAPPVGFLGINYARGTHRESSPHKYAIFWTTHRSFGNEDGGHFFIADYGIRIKGASNSLVVWRPSDWHGTTLSGKGPTNNDNTFRQSGLSIVTPNRLQNIWKKYLKAELTAMEVEEVLDNEDMDSENEIEWE